MSLFKSLDRLRENLSRDTWDVSVACYFFLSPCYLPICLNITILYVPNIWANFPETLSTYQLTLTTGHPRSHLITFCHLCCQYISSASLPGLSVLKCYHPNLLIIFHFVQVCIDAVKRYDTHATNSCMCVHTHNVHTFTFLFTL